MVIQANTFKFNPRLPEWAEKVEPEISVIISSQTLRPGPMPVAGKLDSARSGSGPIDLNANTCSRVQLSLGNFTANNLKMSSIQPFLKTHFSRTTY